jgi:hypothetical protein
MVNQFLNAQEYANVMLLLLKNQLVMGRLVDGQFKDQVTDQNGLVINVKRPPRFIATSGAALQAQDLVTGTQPVQVDQYKNVHISIGDLEYVQSFNALMQNETMKSAASTLAHDVDKFLANKTLGFNSWVAGASTGSVNSYDGTKIIASAAQAMGAHTRLMQNGVPNADLSAVVTFTDGEVIRGSLLAGFTPKTNERALEKVRIPLISEIDWYATQQCPSLTTGSRTQGDGSSTGFTVDNDAGNQNVNYRDVKGTAGTAGMTQTLTVASSDNATTISAGEVFTIENVYAWDWRQQVKLPFLQQFTLTAAPTVTSGGDSTFTITPPIIVQGTADATGSTNTNSAFATVDSIPADGAHIKFVSAASTTQLVKSAFHKRAIALVSARLQMPFTGVASFATDPDTGIAIRYWRGSDITTGNHVHRWDMIYGASVMDNFLGTRISGS